MIPPNAMHPTPDCPFPQLIKPEDECLCPYVVCNNNLNRKRTVFDKSLNHKYAYELQHSSYLNRLGRNRRASTASLKGANFHPVISYSTAAEPFVIAASI